MSPETKLYIHKMADTLCALTEEEIHALKHGCSYLHAMAEGRDAP